MNNPVITPAGACLKHQAAGKEASDAMPCKNESPGGTSAHKQLGAASRRRRCSGRTGETPAEQACAVLVFGLEIHFRLQGAPEPFFAAEVPALALELEIQVVPGSWPGQELHSGRRSPGTDQTGVDGARIVARDLTVIRRELPISKLPHR